MTVPASKSHGILPSPFRMQYFLQDQVIATACEQDASSSHHDSHKWHLTVVDRGSEIEVAPQSRVHAVSGGPSPEG